MTSPSSVLAALALLGGYRGQFFDGGSATADDKLNANQLRYKKLLNDCSDPTELLLLWQRMNNAERLVLRAPL